MKKLILAYILVLGGLYAQSQPYNNEWIDYSKTYYKFKLAVTGVYRISIADLAAVGLDNTPAQDFQLWRNGVEVTLHTSVPSGLLGPGGYLEFYGQMNDGKTDTKLYKTDAEQMSDKWSMYTDSAAYFLTVNPGAANKRYSYPGNNVAANILPAETYFNYTLSKYFRINMNPGYGINLGEVVHSASYEIAEGWSSNALGPGQILYSNNGSLYVYNSGPAATLNTTIVGNTFSSRSASVNLNGNVVQSVFIDGFTIARTNGTSIPLSSLSGNNANFQFSHSGPSGDNIVVSDFQLTYPRQYNFGGASEFYFELPASSEKFIEIANFNYGADSTVLYDINNDLYIRGVAINGLVKFVLPAVTKTRKLFLANLSSQYIKRPAALQPRSFIDYSQPANQGEYVIISHPLLFDNGSGINYVENYRQYRSSFVGGGYHSIIVDVNQLTDQFAFGVEHHPSAIRNFSAFTLSNFVPAPKYFFLIGKGLNYNDYRYHESDPNTKKLALIPTFGYPSSDNLLTAGRTGEYPLIPIGRLSAINGNEVGNYLDKMKQFELAQESTDQTLQGKGWMKNFGQLTGGLNDPGLYGLITSYMQGYQEIASDSLFGGKVYQFSKNTGLNTAIGTDKTLDELLSEGASVINYFGHSSPNNIEFSLDNPENYNNTGKYPLIMINGCNSGDLFQFDTLRAVSKGSLSEKFVFAENKGSIAYIASTHFGLPTQLNYFNTEFYYNLCKNMYGQPLGNIMKTTMQNMYNAFYTDYIAQTHVEEITLHGDPALHLNPHQKPDYLIQDSLLTINPSVVSVADNKIVVTARIINIGLARNDSLKVRIQHKRPDNSLTTIYSSKIKAVIYEDSVMVNLPLNPLVDKGHNQIIVTIDPDNSIDELSETNNSTIRDFDILEDEVRPIWPYEYAIVNSPTPMLFASTANPTAEPKDYVMEMDTTMLFNSPVKVSRVVTDSGGVIGFDPGFSLTDSTVYYWRVTVGPVHPASRWLTSSFVYINSSFDGFNQSHYYQYRNNKFSNIGIDSSTREFGYSAKTRKLLIRTGLYPYYGYDQINVTIDNDQVEYYGCKYLALQFVVYDPLTLKPWKNVNSNGSGRFGSWPVCDLVAGGRNFFEFPYTDSVNRRKAIQFFDSIPNGYYVSITNLGWTGNNTFINDWKKDTATLGSGRSLWHKFHELGFGTIDSFTRNLPFIYVFRKGDPTFPVRQTMGAAANNQLVESFYIDGKQVSGTYVTPWLGPAKSWSRFKWDELPGTGSPSTQRQFEIIGRDNDGYETILAEVYNDKDTSIDYIDASIFPYLQMKMYNTDQTLDKATQLKYWMLTGTKVPEGAIAPNYTYQLADTLGLDDTLHLRVGFRNISNIPFDSIKVKLEITDRFGIRHQYLNQTDGTRLRPLTGDDSVVIVYDIPMAGYLGNNQLMLEVNPDNDQAEQFHFNNYLYRNIVVLNPSLCPDGSTSFIGVPHTLGNTYQWQMDDGTGFVDISDNANFQQTNSDTLLLVNLPTTLYGTRFRCVVTNNSVVSFSEAYVLKFAMTWTGAIDTDWDKAGNWSCNKVPDANTDVFINSGVGNYPVILGVATCRSLNARKGAEISVKNGATLDITGPPGQ